MKKTINHSLRVFSISWQANKLYLPLSIVSNVYKETLYPLLMVVLLARVIDKLEIAQTLIIADFSFTIIIFVLASILKLTLASFLDVKEA